jgi:hypothetical protein
MRLTKKMTWKESSMNKPLSVTAKVSILLVLAVIFGASMIALSLRTHRTADSGRSPVFEGDKNIEKTFTVGSGGTLVLDTDVGNITITGTDSQVVSVRVIARGRQRELERFRVEFGQEGDRVNVNGTYGHEHFGWFGNNSLDVRYEVTTPKNFNLRLSTSGGNIDLSDISGKISGETSGGNLELTGLDGDIKLSTSGGNVSLERSKGTFDLETSGGNMTGRSLTGSIRMETSGGNIDIKDADGKVYASTSGGSIRLSARDNKGIDLSTSGGNVSVTLPKSISADVQAEATGGDVSCDFPFTGKLKEGELHGKINGGGMLIKLETSGGDIVINSTE